MRIRSMTVALLIGVALLFGTAATGEVATSITTTTGTESTTSTSTTSTSTAITSTTIPEEVTTTTVPVTTTSSSTTTTIPPTTSTSTSTSSTVPSSTSSTSTSTVPPTTTTTLIEVVSGDVWIGCSIPDLTSRVLGSMYGTFEAPRVDVSVDGVVRTTLLDPGVYDGTIFNVVEYEAIDGSPLTARLYEGDVLLDEFTALGDCWPNTTLTTEVPATPVEETLPETGMNTSDFALVGAVLLALGVLSMAYLRATR